MEGGDGDIYKINEQVKHDEGQLGGTFRNWGGVLSYSSMVKSFPEMH